MKILHRGEMPDLSKETKTGIQFICHVCKTIWIANINEYTQQTQRTPRGDTTFTCDCPVCNTTQGMIYPNYNIPYVSEDDCDD